MSNLGDWWDRVRGKPSLGNFAREVRSRLEQEGVGSLTYVPEHQELRSETQGGIFFLGNGFSDYRRAKRSDRPGVIERFVSGLAAATAADSLPSDYESARPKLLPILRGADEDAMALLLAQRAPASGASARKIAQANRPTVGGMTMGVAYDLPNSLQRLTMEQLSAWQVDLDRALADALDNLRALPEHGGWVELDHGVWSGQWGDNYESSRLLLPDLIHRRGVPEPVALVPLRSMLLVTSERNEAGLAEMARLAKQALQEHPRWLSVQPLRLRDDDEWEVFEPPASLADDFRELHLTDQAESYGGQKAALEEIYLRDGTDVFVASLMLIRGKNNGQLRSCSTWSKDVDTLLPVTDLIALNRAEGEMLLVPWDAVREVTSALMEETDLAPIRYRVRVFPDDQQWALLKNRTTS